jgi:hypothetical protein
MDDQTFETLQKIRSLLWDAEYEMSINRDDLKFMDSENRINLMRMLRMMAGDITDHIHTECGWATDEV